MCSKDASYDKENIKVSLILLDKGKWNSSTNSNKKSTVDLIVKGS